MVQIRPIFYIQHRTLAQWSLENPILAAGEPGYVTDFGFFKVGDGETPWNDLPEATGSPGPEGPRGPSGPGVLLLGSVANTYLLPFESEVGDAYLVTDPEPNEVWVYGPSGWRLGGVATFGDVVHLTATDPHSQYFLRSGGTLTGDLTIDHNTTDAYLNLSGNRALYHSYALLAQEIANNDYFAGVRRWKMRRSTAWFDISRYDEFGVKLGDALKIENATGLVYVEADPVSDLGVANKGYVDDRDALKLDKTGGTLTGNLYVDKSAPNIRAKATDATNVYFTLASPAGNQRIIEFKTDALNRWHIRTLNDAESGGNAGSSFHIYRYADDGITASSVLNINRATGAGTYYGSMTIAPGVQADLYLKSSSQRLWMMARDSDLKSYIVSSDEANIGKRPLEIQASKVLLASGAESATDSNAVVPKSYVDTADGTKFDKAGGALTGPVLNAYSSISSLRSAKIGTFSGYAASVTGAILIELPAELMTSMTKIRINGYHYVAGDGAFEINVGGYLYSGAPAAAWFNYSVDAVGIDRLPSQTIKLLAKGSTAAGDQRFAISIGEVGTVWSYPQIHVEVDAGHYPSGGDNALASLAVISMSTNLSAWTAVYTPTVNILAPKSYVDTADNLKYDKVGGSLSGDVIINKATPRVQLNHGGVGAVSLGINGLKGAVRNEGNSALTQMQVATPTADEDASTKAYADTGSGTTADGTYASGWSGYVTPRFTRVGKLVTMEAQFRKITSSLAMTANTNYTLATIPSGFRPISSSPALGLMLASTGWVLARFSFESSGTIQMMVNPGATINVDAWVIINASWRTS